MRPLYEITLDLMKLNDLLDEIEGDLSRLAEMEPAVSAWMDALAGEESQKFDGYVNWILTLEMEASTARAAADQYEAKARTRENRVKWLKERLKQHLVILGKLKVQTDAERTVVVQRNGGKPPLVIAEGTKPDRVEDRFVRSILEIDREAVRKALESGEEVLCARLDNPGTHLRIN